MAVHSPRVIQRQPDTVHVSAPAGNAPLAAPSLENGDRLTRPEFERRYAAMPQLKKAELIEGIVYMSSPLKYDEHAVPHSKVITWLSVYAASTRYTACADNATVRIDIDNEVQPDALLHIDAAAGGAAQVTPDGYLQGAPELIVEIAASSASNDLHDKFRVYRRAGVQEYAVWQVYERRFDWWALDSTNGDYLPLGADVDGIIRSKTFPGLWLNMTALISGNLADVLKSLQQGLNSAEHADFLKRLTIAR